MVRSLDPTFPLFPVFAFLAFLVSLIPLPWHIQAWNAGTCTYMIWIAISNLIEFVNSLVWSGSVNNVAPIWCDISSKLLLGAGIGIPAAPLCISHRLYNITAVQTATVTYQDKRKAVISDLCVGVGIPILIMVLHVIVQPHRFDILEDIGCYPVVYNTLPAYFLFFLWPIILGCVSFVYSALTLRCFWMRRIQFNQLISSKTSMSTNRYFRLMSLAFINMLFTLPLGLYSIYIGNKGVGLAPWISWSETHFNFGRVGIYPTIIWRSDKSFETSVELTRWLYVISGLIFFALFGFASEAQRHYKAVFWWFAKRVGFKLLNDRGSKTLLPSWQKPLYASPNASHGSLPVYIPRRSISPDDQKKRPESSLGATGVELEDTESSVNSPTSAETTIATPEHTKCFAAEAVHESAITPSTTATPSLSSKHSDYSLHSARSNELPDLMRSIRIRPPSPMPFSDVVPPFHRLFVLSSVCPTSMPHPRRGATDAIQVMVHTTEVSHVV